MIAIMLTFAVWWNMAWCRLDLLCLGVIFGIYLTYSNFIRDINKNQEEVSYKQKLTTKKVISNHCDIYSGHVCMDFFRAETFKEAMDNQIYFLFTVYPLYETMSSMISLFLVLGFLYLLISNENFTMTGFQLSIRKINSLKSLALPFYSR